MHKRRLPIIAFIMMICFLSPVRAIADWINLSGVQNAPNIAEIHIHEDHVKIQLEIFVNDIKTFDRLIPDEFFAGTHIIRAPLEERMQQFSNQDLQVLADNGQKLQAALKLIEPRLRKKRPSPISWKINPYTGQPIPGPPEDKRVLYAELIYPFTKKPSLLTFIPPLDEKAKMCVGYDVTTVIHP